MTDLTPPEAASRLTHDVFVSYRRLEPDRSWVRRRFVPALRAAALRVFLDDDDFRLGEPLIEGMTRGVEVSRYTVAVLSQAYLDSTFTEVESLMAEHLGLENAEARLIRIWLDLTDDADLDDGVARLAREIRAPWPTASAPP
jgi:hypothetical protein